MSSDQDGAPDEAEGLPLYLQVTTSLRMAIHRGIYPVGARIPTESELCDRYKVSRHTIREALRRLREEGLIASPPGSRPVVAVPAIPAGREDLGSEISADIFDYVISTRLRIDSMEMVTITRALAQETGLPADEQWFRVAGYRTHVDDGHITCWNAYYLAARFASLGRLLTRHVGPFLPLLEDLFNERVARFTRAMTATPMPAEQAAMFGVAEGSPALSILNRCETGNGETALLHHSIHPGTTVRYVIQR